MNTSRLPISNAAIRFARATSMKLAGRKIVVSTSIPVRAGRQVSHRLVDALRHVQGVRPGELLHDEEDARPVVDDRLAVQWLMPADQSRHFAERDELAVTTLDLDVGEVCGRHDRRHVMDVQALVGGLDESAGPERVRLRELEDALVEGFRGGLHHGLDGDAMLRQLLRDRQDVELLQALAEDHHVGNAGYAEHARPNSPVRDAGQIEQVDRVRRQADLHDPARR